MAKKLSAESKLSGKTELLLGNLQRQAGRERKKAHMRGKKKGGKGGEFVEKKKNMTESVEKRETQGGLNHVRTEKRSKKKREGK